MRRQALWALDAALHKRRVSRRHSNDADAEAFAWAVAMAPMAAEGTLPAAVAEHFFAKFDNQSVREALDHVRYLFPGRHPQHLPAAYEKLMGQANFEHVDTIRMQKHGARDPQLVKEFEDGRRQLQKLRQAFVLLENNPPLGASYFDPPVQARYQSRLAKLRGDMRQIDDRLRTLVQRLSS